VQTYGHLSIVVTEEEHQLLLAYNEYAKPMRREVNGTFFVSWSGGPVTSSYLSTIIAKRFSELELAPEMRITATKLRHITVSLVIVLRKKTLERKYDIMCRFYVISRL
jgi:hypothetical protein